MPGFRLIPFVPFLFLSSILLFAGCGGSTGDGMVDVSGVVVFSDGTPVSGEMATVVFLPNRANEPAKSASGTIGEDGRFTLMTNAPEDGAYPGEYRVVL